MKNHIITIKSSECHKKENYYFKDGTKRKIATLFYL